MAAVLGPTPLDGDEPVLGLIDRPFCKEIEGQLASLTGDETKSLLDSGPFLVRQSSRTDRVDHELHIRVSNRLPRGQVFPQPVKRHVAVHIVRILTEDRAHQF